MRRKLGKNDWILLGTLAAVCLILFCVFRFLSGSGGDRVVITVDGETYGTYSLAEDQEIPVKQDGRVTNVVCISGGKGHMEEADCPDHLCIRQGEISSEYASIVCLPNRVVVEVVSDDEPALDGMSG